MDYSQADSGASFTEIAAFIEANPEWPGQTLLRRRAEEAMDADEPAERVLDWFRRHPPVSTDGQIHQAAATLALEGARCRPPP